MEILPRPQKHNKCIISITTSNKNLAHGLKNTEMFKFYKFLVKNFNRSTSIKHKIGLYHAQISYGTTQLILVNILGNKGVNGGTIE